MLQTGSVVDEAVVELVIGVVVVVVVVVAVAGVVGILDEYFFFDDWSWNLKRGLRLRSCYHYRCHLGP